MKRFMALILAATLLLSLAGCSYFSKGQQADFYYLRREYQYTAPVGALAAESKEIGSIDPEYIIKVYLMGPSAENLRSPFPAGTTFVNVVQDGSALSVGLSLGTSMSDSMFTAASGCLALTLFELPDIDTVTVEAGKHAITIKAGAIVLEDTPK